MRALLLTTITFTGLMIGGGTVAQETDHSPAKPAAKQVRHPKLSGLATTAQPALATIRPPAPRIETPSTPDWTGFHVGATFGRGS